MRKALYWEKRDEGVVQCLLCPHHCVIAPGKVGLCQVRRNNEGELYSLNYGYISSAHLDPIEKKPLYHFYPGSWIMSVGTLGCNLSCAFCQNASISQIPRNEIDRYFKTMAQAVEPDEIVTLAEKAMPRGNIGVAYTYNEPSIWYEFVIECARKIREKGMKNVLVSNGYLEIEPLKELVPYIDAVNVDLKSIKDSFYRKLCGGRLDPVLEYLKTMKSSGVMIELTNLIITGENDSKEEIEELVDWIAENLGRETPLHFSRYHPDYKFTAPSTPINTLGMAYETAIKKLDYVYVGNVWEGTWDTTRCPGCHAPVVEREARQASVSALKDGNKCDRCGAKVNIIR